MGRGLVFRYVRVRVRWLRAGYMLVNITPESKSMWCVHTYRSHIDRHVVMHIYGTHFVQTALSNTIVKMYLNPT